MGTKVKEICTVLSQECIGKDIYSMWIPDKKDPYRGSRGWGQFVSVYTQDGSKLLPRPISLCEIDKEKGALRLVYRVTGPKTGTESFSRLHAGAQLELLGPLGNGFAGRAAGRKVFLMGGGIGVPPMLETMKQLDAKKIAVLGYRDELFLNEEFEKMVRYTLQQKWLCRNQGNVMNAIRENDLEADVIFACGPKPMLRAIKAYALEKGIPCWVSMEERMACGIGACLGCVCQSTETDAHSHVHNKRVCKDGPVFRSTEVEL